MPGPAHMVRFGAFEADLRSHELWKSGVRVPLQEKPFQILACLLEQPGQVVTRAELQKQLWPDVVVDTEVGLNNAIKKLRDALGDVPERPRFVETLKGRGYRFVAEVYGAHQEQRAPTAVSTREATDSSRVRQWFTRTVTVAVPIALAAAGITVWRVTNPIPKGTSARSILVSPLEVAGQTEGDGYAGRAFAEAVAVNLAMSDSIHVLPVPARPVDREPASDTERVGFVLAGSISQEEGALEITVTLVDPQANRVLWGTQETVERGELARLASMIANRVAEHVGARPLKLYDYFRHVLGNEAMASWPELPATISAVRRHDIQAAGPLTSRLLAAFPGQYDAHVMRITVLIDTSSEESQKELEQRAVALERLDPRAPIVTMLKAWGAETREQRIQVLTELAARDDLTPACRAHALRTRGLAFSGADSLEAASADLTEAVRLDPANVYNYTYHAVVLRRAGKLDEALARLEQAVQLDPVVAYGDMAMYWAVVGDEAETLAALRKAVRVGFKSAAWIQTTSVGVLLEGNSEYEALLAAMQDENDTSPSDD